jgi:hypothetical protein
MNLGLGSLDRLLLDFFADEFSFDQAEQLLGVPAPHQHNPHTTLLIPHPRSLAAGIELEKLQRGPDSPPMLAGIMLTFARPVQIDFRLLREAFGEAVAGPLIYPGGPRNLEFAFHNEFFECSIAFDVPQRSLGRDVRAVERIILRRIPLGAFTGGK